MENANTLQMGSNFEKKSINDKTIFTSGFLFIE